MEVKNLLTTEGAEILQGMLEPFVSAVVERVAQRVKELEEQKEPRYYSRAECAELLHVTLPTLHDFVRRGLLHPQRVGGRVLFDAVAVDEAIRTRRIYKNMRKGGVL